jgi:uncharacterized protein
MEQEFLRPFWKQLKIPPWVLSLLVLAILAGVRFYSVFGPPRMRFLFLVQALVMWLLPAIFLSAAGPQAIGLVRPCRGAGALALCAAIGVVAGLVLFSVSTSLHGSPSDNWIASVRAGMQLDRMRAVMGPAAILAMLAVPALIVTPVGEEILFRGLIHQAFTMRWNWIAGIAVNSLAFGLVHLHVHGLTHDAAGFHLRVVSGGMFVLGGALLSAVFTLCRMRTGSLFAAMAAHAGCNTAVIAAIVLAPAG